MQNCQTLMRLAFIKNRLLINKLGEFGRKAEMSRRISKLIAGALSGVALLLSPVNVNADVININYSAVDPSAIPAVRAAEAIWEARIQAYSTELPRAIRDQLGSLTIDATVEPIDGAGGILGQAGPTAILTLGSSRRNFAVALRSQMTFDLDDFPSMTADGILVTVIAHEMGHALGFGTLFDGNGLVGPLNGFGQTEYINGEYALIGYRRDISNPVASFVPLEQRGGAGTALGHWVDLPPFFNQAFTGAFKKELMTGFIGDLDPDTGAIVFANSFVAQATWGAMADLGFAVEGVNGAFAAKKGRGTGRWPKITGQGSNPFENNGIPPAEDLRFNLVSIKGVSKVSLGSKGTGAEDVETTVGDDPYSLRNHRWAK